MKKKITGILMSPEEIIPIRGIVGVGVYCLELPGADDWKPDFFLAKNELSGKRHELLETPDGDNYMIDEADPRLLPGDTFPKSWFKEIQEEYDYEEFEKNCQFVKAWHGDEKLYVYGNYLRHIHDEKITYSHPHGVECFNYNFRHDCIDLKIKYFQHVKPMKEPEEM